MKLIKANLILINFLINSLFAELLFFYDKASYKYQVKLYTISTKSTESLLDLTNLEVKCPNNALLVSFTYLIEIKSFITINFECLEITDGYLKKTIRQTNWTTLDKNLKQTGHYLDRQEVKCEFGEAINSFKLISNSKGEISYDFTCGVFINKLQLKCTKLNSNKLSYSGYSHSALNSMTVGDSKTFISEFKFQIDWNKNGNYKYFIHNKCVYDPIHNILN